MFSFILGFLIVLYILSVLHTRAKITQYKEIKAHVYHQLLEKYDSHEIAVRIINGQVWKGQTLEQLADSIGLTSTMSERVMKTKTRVTYKYHPITKTRFGLTVVLEDGIVTSWKAA